ncbi:class I SAM-dependent methyltransferase [Geomesophilobacter sediminis]|uniref:Class I SAM-dependent methyltransferase n=1 Tax=Geomesophilobacter sediminis TaxID=2798584 RepID=A0A8J7S822_9BACT|nr:class I SAM-dependent methyltransferase [Geomesophilobacter sediminis]MBJ6727312.1 class I SAM-dependent methyltransferase [Geomesophilobacter sediminis]
MSMLLDAKNALSLLACGEWSEFILRIRIHRQKIDLRNTYLDELQLPEDRCHYYANSGGLHLHRVLRALGITARDAVIDFGSGKGGALITLSRYPFARILGVEIAPELVAVARNNVAKLGIANVEMVVADAADFTDLDDFNYFYFFSPFPGAVMRAVMDNICASLARRPRPATVIYFNPEFHDEVIAGAHFFKIREFDHHPLRFFIYRNQTQP